MHVKVEVGSNRARITSDQFKPIWFESNDSLQTVQADYALWAIAPIAMRFGGEINCDFVVSEATYHSVKEVVSVWSGWCPEIYCRPNFITAGLTSNKKGHGNLAFFSGGIDATYSAAKMRDSKFQSDCLIVHGLDYNHIQDSQFYELLKATHKTRRDSFNKTHIIKTNISEVYSSIGCNPSDGHVTHIFALFACASLFANYDKYFISSDYRLDQQFVKHPYGSNSATNRLMRNAFGVLKTLDDDVSRGTKVKFLHDLKIDLKSLSICKNKKIRPKNCGKCEKCLRTKVMFYASTGCVPKIFLDLSIPPKWFKKIKISFLRDIIDISLNEEVSNSLDLHNASQYLISNTISKRNNPLHEFSLKKLFKYLFFNRGVKPIKNKK